MLVEIKQKIARIVANSKVVDKQRNKRTTGSTLSFERLESRKVLATNIVFDATAGLLSFYGDAGNDVVSVVESGSTLTVTANGNGTQTFNTSEVSKIFFSGDAGDDTFSNFSSIELEAFGNDGNDTITGGSAEDFISGGRGDDIISGGDNDDELRGGQGNDTLNGDTGNDRLNGSAGDDTLYGGDGDDVLFGRNGNDVIRGGDNNDVLRGGRDGDRIYGDTGNDRLFGQHGDDVVEGGTGDDLLRGGRGSDYLSGFEGADRIFGGRDNDRLYGHQGADFLSGGDGNDGLFGGQNSEADSLTGGGGSDRFLVQGSDSVGDRGSTDSVLVFENETDQWTDAEIEVLDNGFQALHDRITDGTLLRDSVDSGDLTFYKYQSLGAAAGINAFGYSFIGTEFFDFTREIRIADWDETSDFFNEQFTSVTIHEIFHNWDSTLELGEYNDLDSLIVDFQSISGWTQANRSGNPNFTQSLDGEWYYLSSSVFADERGRINPFEDVAELSEYYFRNIDSNNHGDLQEKFDWFDNLLNQL